MSHATNLTVRTPVPFITPAPTRREMELTPADVGPGVGGQARSVTRAEGEAVQLDRQSFVARLTARHGETFSDRLSAKQRGYLDGATLSQKRATQIETTLAVAPAKPDARSKPNARSRPSPALRAALEVLFESPVLQRSHLKHMLLNALPLNDARGVILTHLTALQRSELAPHLAALTRLRAYEGRNGFERLATYFVAAQQHANYLETAAHQLIQLVSARGPNHPDSPILGKCHHYLQSQSAAVQVPSFDVGGALHRAVYTTIGTAIGGDIQERDRANFDALMDTAEALEHTEVSEYFNEREYTPAVLLDGGDAVHPLWQHMLEDDRVPEVVGSDAAYDYMRARERGNALCNEIVRSDEMSGEHSATIHQRLNNLHGAMAHEQNVLPYVIEALCNHLGPASVFDPRLRELDREFRTNRKDWENFQGL